MALPSLFWPSGRRLFRRTGRRARKLLLAFLMVAVLIAVMWSFLAVLWA